MTKITPNMLSIFPFNNAKFKALCALTCSFFLCLPFERAVAQDVTSTIKYGNDIWSLKDLPRIRETSPPETSTYVVFMISKNYQGNWVLGGDLKDPTTEMLYVDRQTRRIGPFTSSKNTLSKYYLCEEKSAGRLALQSAQLYNACRSDFYTADAGVKVATLAVMCAVAACLGGYDTNWYPIFRPHKLKQALLSSGLMAKFDAYFQRQQQLLINQHAAELKHKTNILLDFIDTVDGDSQDVASLNSSLESLDTYSQSYKQAWDDFLEGFAKADYSDLPFALSWNKTLSMRSESSELAKSANKRINNMRELLSNNLNEIRLAEREIIRKIQLRLKDHSYYLSSVDGLFGSGTISAIQSFSKDIDQLILNGKKSEILQTVNDSFMLPVGSCSGASSDGAYVACFSIE